MIRYSFQEVSFFVRELKRKRKPEPVLGNGEQIADEIPRDEQAKMRENLLKYCKRDTWAMVKLLESLRNIANEDETSRDAVGNA